MPEEALETPQPAHPVETKTTSWPKVILAAVLGLGLLAASALAGYYYGIQGSRSGQPFPLNDAGAVYRISKDGQKFLLSYTKGGQTQKIKIGQSSVDLEPYIGKNVLVEGRFRTENETVQCVRAPCPPVKITVLDISGVRVKQ